MRPEPGPPPPPRAPPPPESGTATASDEGALTHRRWNAIDTALVIAFALILIGYVVGSKYVSRHVREDAWLTGYVMPKPTELFLQLDEWCERIGAFGSPVGSFLPFFFFCGAMLSPRPDRRRALAAVALLVELLVIAIYVFVVVALPRISV